MEDGAEVEEGDGAGAGADVDTGTGTVVVKVTGMEAWLGTEPGTMVGVDDADGMVPFVPAMNVRQQQNRIRTIEFRVGMNAIPIGRSSIFRGHTSILVMAIFDACRLP